VAPSIERCAAIQVMQRARRLGRPVITKWPGGRMQRRGRATTNEPTCTRRRLEIKVFQGCQTQFPVRKRQLAAGVRSFAFATHGVRFPPPPHPVPPRGRVRTALAAARRLFAPRRRHRPALVLRPGPAGARTCRSGLRRHRRWSSGNIRRPAPRGRRLTPKRQRCSSRPPRPRGTAGSPGRFLPSVQFSFLVHR